MTILTPAQVFRKFATDGVPESGKWEPNKDEIVQLLERIQDSTGAKYSVATKADLDAIVPTAGEQPRGEVLDDPDAGNNGWYAWDSDTSAWVFERGFPDTLAAITLAGTANAQTGTVGSGVNPADIEVYYAVVTTANTGPMTLSISGETARDVVNAAGNALSAGEWTGVVLFTLNDDGDYQLIIDAGAAASAAQSATIAQDAAAAAQGAAGSIAFDGSFGLGLAADGTTDDVPALVALESSAQEVIRLKNATYYIGTDYTPTKTLRFSSGTKFLIAEGVTVDFSQAEPEIHSPKKQRFYFDGTGTGAVVGLDVTWSGWFAGDKLNTDIDAYAELQKWADSVSVGGVMRMAPALHPVDGATYILVRNRPCIRGTNRERCKLRFVGTAQMTHGFEFTTDNGDLGGSVENIGYERRWPMAAPSGGYACVFHTRRWRAAHLLSHGMYSALYADGADGRFFDCDSFDTHRHAFHVVGANEPHGNNCIFAANSSWVSLANIVGTFENGESFTFSGVSGSGIGNAVFFDADGNYKFITTNTGADIDLYVGATITGDTSGATADVTAIAHGHDGGALRIEGRVHASQFTQLEISGGLHPLVMQASSPDNAGRALSTKFTACHFDSAKNGSALLFSPAGTQFIACWFSSFQTAGQDLYLENTYGTDIIGCQWTSTHKKAISIGANTQDTRILGGIIADTNTSGVSGTPVIDIGDGATGSIVGMSIGRSYGYGPGNPQIGIRIGVGAEFTLDNVDAASCPTPVQNNSGGTAKIINCKGYKTYAVGADAVSTDAAGNASVPHGLAEAPVWADVKTTSNTAIEYQVTGLDAANIYFRARNTTTDANYASNPVNVRWEARAQSAV